MQPVRLRAAVLAMCVQGMLTRSLVRLRAQRETYDQNGGIEVVDGEQEMDSDIDMTEKGFERWYAAVVALHDDQAMCRFVKRLLATQDKFVPQDQEGELAGFVSWFSGRRATQSLKQMRKQLSKVEWVVDLKDVDGSTFTEADYQSVAALSNDTAMALFVQAVLEGDDKFVPQDQEHELMGFVPWFSGTKAVQNLQQLRHELSHKRWARKTQHNVSMAVAPVKSDKLEEKPEKTGKGAEHRGKKIGKLGDKSEKFGSKLRSVFDKLVKAFASESSSTAKCSDCIVWGNVNILSFNAYTNRVAVHPPNTLELAAQKGTTDQFSGTEAGTYWLVDSSNVKIQGRYWQTNKTKSGVGLGALAISGPIVGDNTFVIRSLAGKVMWNNEEILQRVSYNYSNQFLTAKYMSDVGPVGAASHAPGIDVDFANGVRLRVARYRQQLGARISLCDSDAGDSGIDGQCGNLEEIPPKSAHEWLAIQGAAEKLPKSEIIFRDDLVGHRSDNILQRKGS